MRLSTSRPSTLGSFRSSSTSVGSLFTSRRRMRAAKQVIQRILPVFGHHQLVGDVAFRQGAAGQRDIAGLSSTKRIILGFILLLKVK